jgi:hypothetical protein
MVWFLWVRSLLLLLWIDETISLVSPTINDRPTASTTTTPLQFELYSAEEIATTIDRWGTHYSAWLYVSTAQTEYGLPTAGRDTDCPFDRNVVGCHNRFLILNDHPRPAHQENNNNDHQYQYQDPTIPHVLWSGALHGNERVGPTAVLEATQLLLSAVECHALPQWELQDDTELWPMVLQHAYDCRRDLYETYGLSHDQLTWLARLYYTRRLIVVPTANAVGYFRNTREEDFGVDPNRDFPYDTKPTACMQTIAARTLNELYQANLIQLSLTFHGGMEVIGYEWGAPSYVDQHVSPDDTAQHDIAEYYSKFAGGFTGTPPYAVGPYVTICVCVCVSV